MNIRNFVIISHVDHGKSTLADRLLEITATVSSRQMKDQYLDQLELERERGITIKMAPVRMLYTLNNQKYILNLIDTPGHSDFHYEVSRALAAVEGAVLLVDVTKGIQAQTLANFYDAKKAGLKIIGAVNKVDIQSFRVEKVIKETAELIGCSPDEIFKISGKTGQGVEELLGAIVKRFPEPKSLGNECSLVFDSFYDEHRGVVAAVRVFNGGIKMEDSVYFVAGKERTKVKEVGYFSPELKRSDNLNAGEIGYLITGIKNPEKLKIGDTVVQNPKSKNIGLEMALPGYAEPQSVVFVSFYAEDSSQYDDLRVAFQKLKLNDSSLKIQEDFNEALGRGFKVGFLGKLHFEITAERLEKEFFVKTVNTFPSVAYKIPSKSGYEIIENQIDLPDDLEGIMEPMIKMEIIAPVEYLGVVLRLKDLYRWENIETRNLGEENERIIISFKMPLAELISDFDSQLKSVSAGFASYNYEIAGFRPSKLAKVKILIASKDAPGLVRIVPDDRLLLESRKMAKRLKELLPRQQFVQAIQVFSGGRIIARENIPALKKDVAGYLYGGDRSRKMKLWKKQKRGKKKLLKMASGVKIPVQVFKDLLK